MAEPAQAPFNRSLTIHPAKSAWHSRPATPRWLRSVMPISEIPLFAMLRTRMQWHQERQRLLAENVANADTPKFKPRDLTPPKLDRMVTAAAAQPLGLVRTTAGHISGGLTGGTQFQTDRTTGSE